MLKRQVEEQQAQIQGLLCNSSTPSGVARPVLPGPSTLALGSTRLSASDPARGGGATKRKRRQDPKPVLKHRVFVRGVVREDMGVYGPCR